MRQVSPGFLDAWRNGGTRVSRVSVARSWGSPWTVVDHTGFDINGRRGPQIVARYSGTVDLAPTVDTALLSTRGGWIRVESGFVVAGEWEMVPVATMRIYEVDRSRAGAMQVTAHSVERVLESARFLQPTSYDAGYGIGILKRLLAAGGVDVAVLTKKDRWVPRMTIELERWGDGVRAIETALDVEVWADPLGHLVVGDPSFVTDLAVLENVPVVDWTQSETAENVPSGVIVEGASVTTGDTSAVVRGTAVDDNPTSDTYYLGPYGLVVPTPIRNELMTSNEMCLAAAQTYLRNMRGKGKTLTLSGLPMHALEPGDVVTAEVDGELVRYIADHITYRNRGPQGLEARTDE